MESQTQDVLTSILGDEFKVEVEKRDKIIKQLNARKESLESEILSLGKQLEELNVKKNGLQEEITLAYSKKEEDFKKEKSDFESSKSNSISALDTREKNLNDAEIVYSNKVKEHQNNTAKLAHDKSEFEMKKTSIAETLEQAGQAHTDLFKEAVDALRENSSVVKPTPVTPVESTEE